MKPDTKINQETKNRAKKLIITILLIIFLVGGFSYAFVTFSYNSDQIETIQAKCFKIQMEDQGAINITNAIPTPDTTGIHQETYNYTIKNTCDLNAHYETTINVLSPSVLADASKVRVALHGDSYLTPTTLSSLQTGEFTSAYTNPLANSIGNYKLDVGFIPANTTRTFKLNMWISNDTTEFNNEFKTQLLIIAVAENGQTFSNATSGNDVIKNNPTITKDYDYKKIVTSGLHYIERKTDQKAYYFRNNVENNYVNFANKTWRIIKINEDGSIKLILDDTIGTSQYGSNPLYTLSTIKSTLDTWYENNLLTNDQYIKQDNYCNDTGTYVNLSGTYYNGYRRIVTNQVPKFNCISTYSSKIGILSADEAMYAGAIYDTANTTTYLHNTNESWTSTPASGSLNVFTYGGDKSLQIKASTESLSIRPVITMTKDAILEGNGTVDNKFTITGLYTNLPEAYNDTVAPTIEYARTTTQWKKENKSIYYATKDENYGSGIKGYIVTTTNTTPASNDPSWVSSPKNETNTIAYDAGTYYLWTKDKSNNISNSKQVIINKIDKILPTCTLTSTIVKNGYKLTLTGTDNNGINKLGYSFDNEEYHELNTKIVTTTGTYTGYVKDVAGNISNACSIEITQPAADELIAKVGTDGLVEITHPANNTLQIGATTPITEYRYQGRNGCDGVAMTQEICTLLGGTTLYGTACTDAHNYYITQNLNPAQCTQYGGTYNSNMVNNYVNFNGIDGDYRIIGVFPTDDGTGNITNRIKLIKTTNYHSYYWNNYTHNNKWGEASLNETLNDTYYNSLINKGLIDSVKYYLGGYKDDAFTNETMYQYERKIINGVCGTDSSSGFDITTGNECYYYPGNPTSWTGKIGLMYASDYMYGSADCNGKVGYNTSTTDTSACRTTNWLYLGSEEWTITENTESSGVVFSITTEGSIYGAFTIIDVSITFPVRPVQYLKPDTIITGGTGTIDDPYTFGSAE